MLSFYLVGFKKLLSIGKKIFLVLVVYFVVISLFFHFIAQDKPKLTYDPVKKNREEIYKTINDPQLNKTQEGKLTIAIYRSMLCGMMGEACTDNPADGDKNFSHSLFGFMSNLIVLPYVNPPASGVYWAYSGLQNAGFVPKTYAAEGIGFAAIKPLMSIWKVFRDLSYMLLVLVLIAIGFMIMFRAKINPQTVISVENSLPKIVIALLLITFSFPIAGFLIDLMYFLIILAIVILSNRGNFFPTNEFIDKYTNPDSINLFFSFWPGGVWSALFGGGSTVNIGQSLLNIFPSIMNVIIRLLSGVGVALLLDKLIYRFATKDLVEPVADMLQGVDLEGSAGVTIGGDAQAPGASAGIKAIANPIIKSILLTLGFTIGTNGLPIILGILIFLTLIFLLFRIFFMLFSTYLNILLLIIFSPFILIFEAIPGKSTFSFWIKNLFAELLTFPLVIIILLIGYIMAFNPATRLTDLWHPPFLTSMEPDALLYLIGMGLIFMIPDLVKMFKELLGAKGLPISIGPGAFFAGVGAGLASAQAGLGMTSSLAQMPIIGPALVRAQGGIGGYLKKIGIIQPPLAEQVGDILLKKQGKT